MKRKNIATAYAIGAAALYALNIPISKLLLDHAGPTMMAAFLYLGAGLGMFVYSIILKTHCTFSKANNQLKAYFLL